MSKHLLPLFLTTVLCLPACGTGTVSAPKPIDFRSTWINVSGIDRSTDGNYHSSSPATIHYFIGLQGGTGDGGKYWTKIEVDFGEGDGWHDVTALAPEWYVTLKGTPHTYIEPGTYEMRARVTYNDGEVVYSDQPQPGSAARRYIFVLAAPHLRAYAVATTLSPALCSG